jgi:hypothetical protein
VTLKFAETYYTSSGMRTFHVRINGQIVERHVDVFAIGRGMWKPADRSYTIPVTGGSIMIELLPGNNNPFINGIVIKQ